MPDRRSASDIDVTSSSTHGRLACVIEQCGGASHGENCKARSMTASSPSMNDVAPLAGSEASVVVRSVLPGRFRFWVPGLYRNEGLKRALESGLHGAESRRRVSANVI